MKIPAEWLTLAKQLFDEVPTAAKTDYALKSFKLAWSKALARLRKKRAISEKLREEMAAEKNVSRIFANFLADKAADPEEYVDELKQIAGKPKNRSNVVKAIKKSFKKRAQKPAVRKLAKKTTRTLTQNGQKKGTPKAKGSRTAQSRRSSKKTSSSRASKKARR